MLLMLLTEIKILAKEIVQSVIANRRHLHSNPELSFQEFKTAVFVQEQLTAMNIPWQTIANTGVLATIKGDMPSTAIIALRADMDALPITELNAFSYASRNIGVMHACGHDAHTASLLGTASILKTLNAKFAGTIKLLFQPGEEQLPGGASLMIKAGALQNPAPSAIIGQHVMPSLPVGKVAMRKGKFMASKDDLYITINGRGGHGAQPHQNIDPVVIAAHIIIALQQVASRMSNPFIPSVLSIGKVIAAGSTNIIPNEVQMEGTFRTMDEHWRSTALQQMKQLAEGIAESMGGSCLFNIESGYPFLVNADALTTTVSTAAAAYLGADNVLEAEIWTASEDFAYYSQLTDACFYLLGAGNTQKGITASLHTPDFDIDEDALAISTGLMAYIALTQLGN
jgi:amidohydrolase